MPAGFRNTKVHFDECDGFSDPLTALLTAYVPVTKEAPKARAPASAQTQIEPPLRQDVTGGTLRCHMKGMVDRRLRRQCAKADAFGVLRRGDSDHERIGHRSRRVEY